MAFDLGFNFRGTAEFVTDPSFGVPVLAEAYPNTYTAANGYSINAGWTTAMSAANRDATNDARIAGINYGSTQIFQVDLSSGSAPGAGTYTIDIAAGDAASDNEASYKLFDTTTVLIDGTNGGVGVTTGAADKYQSAVPNEIITATTTWTGTTAVKAFATTTATLQLFDISSGTPVMAHFRLTLQGGGAATTRLQHLAYGISNGIFLGR